MARRPARLHVDPERVCRGCGRKKLDCPCWAAGAGDEAAASRADLTTDQLALLDYVKIRMESGCDSMGVLVEAVNIELTHERRTLRWRLRLIWRLFRG